MSNEKLKTSEPFGSTLWPNLLRYRTFAVAHYSSMSGALHIRPQSACTFWVGCFLSCTQSFNIVFLIPDNV